MKYKNLKQYYDFLPKPKLKFCREIKKKTGVSLVTASAWCKFDSQTKNPKYLAILSEMTGIPKDDLFKEED